MEGLFLPLLLMLVIAIPLVLTTRRQKKMMAQQQELQSSLTLGDRVMTTSGLYATVVDVSDETTVDLEIAEDVVTTWVRHAVRERINPEDDEELLDEDETVADDEDVTDEVDNDVEGASPEVVAPADHSKK